MKLKSILLLILFFVFAPLYATGKPIVKIQTWDTSNGAHVYFVNAPEIPMVDVQVAFAAGSAYDGKHWGVASLVNSMLDQGTKKHNANQIADTFDNVGAEISGEVDRDKVVVSLRSLTESKYLNSALDMFTEILAHPSFPEKAFQRAQNQALVAIQQSHQQPSSVAKLAFYRALYDDEPYAYPSLGTLNTVKSLTRDQVESFYKKYYVGSNADVIIVGDVSKNQAKNMAQQLIGSLPKGEHARALAKAKDIEKGSYQFIEFPAKQNTIIIGQVGIAPRSQDYFPLTVGNYIFGGLPLTSILFEHVRNQHGLAYRVQSQFIPLQYRGPFVIALQTRSSKTKQAMYVVQQILRNYVKNGPTKAQVNAAKKNLQDSFALKINTNNDIIANVLNIAFYHLPLNYLDRYRDRVNAVSAAQIKTAFRNNVHPDKMKIVVVGGMINSKKL